MQCRDRHFRHSWVWYGSALIGLLGGYALWTLRPTPKTTDEGAALLLVAEKPE